jgi:hypothetical protein
MNQLELKNRFTKEASVDAERNRRFGLWETLCKAGGPEGVPPALIKTLGIIRGQQGIFRDKTVTSQITPNGPGITVGVRHTGQTYADELTDEGVIYHYPLTNRRNRDANEIEATKLCGKLNLPLFVVETPNPGSSVRDVHMGWVTRHNDEAREFLILFSTEPISYNDSAQPDETPFVMTGDRASGTGEGKTRPNQKRFKFEVFQRYGAECALCKITVKHLLEAVHLCSVEANGTDDPRNGLVLCRNHHRALDKHLILIDPNTLQVTTAEPHSSEMLGLERSSLEHLSRLPEKEALAWRKNH